MTKKPLSLLFLLSLFATAVAFLFSCLVTLSDGQGALIFVVTLPVMAVFLILARFFGKKLDQTRVPPSHLNKIPTYFAIAIVVFFASAMVPGLNRLTSGFMGAVGKTFELATGKTPRAFFKERKSFPNLLKQKLEESKEGPIHFDSIPVTFAWDRVCIFGPYTNNEQAKKILNMNWNIEESSAIAHSDSVNALVFLYQGKPNTVVDLSRSLADFKNPDLCFERSQTQFTFGRGPSGRVEIQLLK